MRTLKVYLHGATMGTPPASTKHLKAKRGEVHGWSTSATRRNVAFLRSVEPDGLTVDPDGSGLIGWAGTFTLRDCPETSDDWHKLRRSFLKRLERRGLFRCHWVTEWQRRGVPHLHGAFWFPDTVPVPQRYRDLIDSWLAVAEPYTASERAQHVIPITDAIGWFQYVAKHAARGASHYQRSSDGIPEGWQKTGRVWGYTGDWQTRDPLKIMISDDVYYRLRRLVRSWRVADARASGNTYRIAAARSMLTSHHRPTSSVRGISEWVDQDTMLTLLDVAQGSGKVEC